MRARFDFGRRLLLLLLMFGFFLCGCRTTPKVDWNGRIGSFTYDQAVIELGPPDRSAKLSEGALVAEWLTSRGSRYGTVYNFGPWWWGGQVDETQSPDLYLRLIFAPGGKLQSWKKVAH